MNELEKTAQKYAELKRQHMDNEALAVKMIDFISSPDFTFQLKDEVLISNGIATYVYKNNATYPATFDFLAEVLHVKIPIIIKGAKFGPGEIIVKAAGKEQANAELESCVKDLQQLVHAKKSEATSKHGADAS